MWNPYFCLAFELRNFKQASKHTYIKINRTSLITDPRRESVHINTPEREIKGNKML